MGLRPTGRTCDPPCNGPLHDFLLDWDDALPEDQLELAEEHSKKADLIICLGTSLRVQPANKLPLLPLKHGGKLVVSLYLRDGIPGNMKDM
jgi:mono-ADP-ribosyltransferase sirtuin 6